MEFSARLRRPSTLWFAGVLLLCLVAYWPGLYGSWFFDDYHNIVDNTEVQPAQADTESLSRAALSSPSSQLKRPLASLSFAANYLVAGLSPFSWKLTNLFIHLLNGLLLMLLVRALLDALKYDAHRRDRLALLIAAAWLLLPINLSAVLYVVQRMESLANLFVFGGLLGYVYGRRLMLAGRSGDGLFACGFSLVVPTGVGILAKESAALLPLYAVLLEAVVFGFRRHTVQHAVELTPATAATHRDKRVIALFGLLLIPPLIVGVAWLLPWVLRPATWAARDFSLTTRLLSEARIVMDYIAWTLLPRPQNLSFYHDNFQISQGLLSPWTTLASVAGIAALLGLAVWLRRRAPLVTLGIALYFAGHLMTGTVLPLELIYEHRNYFSSAGLLLALLPLLAAGAELPQARLRHLGLGVLLLWWTVLTAFTAHAWGDPLRLAREIVQRAPDSARGQFELGHQLLTRANYAPQDPLTREAFAVLERAAAIPGASVLPEQSLIVVHSVNHLPIADSWWNSLETKLRAKPPDVQDIGAIGALERCMRSGDCALPRERMDAVFAAAMAHPQQSPDLLIIHADYAWNIQQDQDLGQRSAAAAVSSAPREPSYRIMLLRMQLARGQRTEAAASLAELEALNTGGNLDRELAELRGLLGTR